MQPYWRHWHCQVLQYWSLTDIMLVGFTSHMLIRFRFSIPPCFVEQGSSELLKPCLICCSEVREDGTGRSNSHWLINQFIHLYELKLEISNFPASMIWLISYSLMYTFEITPVIASRESMQFSKLTASHFVRTLLKTLC